MSDTRSATPTTMINNDETPEQQYIREEESKQALGNRPAEGNGAAPLQPAKFQHSFWDPQLAPLRAAYFKILGPSTLLLIIMMWLTLPVYWGSLGETSNHIPVLKGWVINRDGSGALGQAVVQAFQANSQGQGVPTGQHLTWEVIDPSSFPMDEDVAHAVVDEQVWTAVVVTTDATQRLTNARSTGNSSYNPQSAVTFYYQQGRNEVAANSYIIPLTQALLTQTLTKFSAQFTGQWLSSASTTDLATAARAPQTVSGAFSFMPNNLRPFTKTVSTAILLVGQIYITIFGFAITMAHDQARGIISPFLRLRSYATLRIVTPLLLYIPISFSYAMISLPFKVTFGERFGYAGGFFIFWIYVYMGMAALGLATEAMITVLTPKFIPNFLIVLIIYNVSVASVPIIMQPSFYRWGYGFPVFNLSQAVRAIIFNTKSHLGLNAGVLIAWIALSMITTTVFTWMARRRAVLAESREPTIEEGKAQ